MLDCAGSKLDYNISRGSSQFAFLSPSSTYSLLKDSIRRRERERWYLTSSLLQAYDYEIEQHWTLYYSFKTSHTCTQVKYRLHEKLNCSTFLHYSTPLIILSHPSQITYLYCKERLHHLQEELRRWSLRFVAQPSLITSHYHTSHHSNKHKTCRAPFLHSSNLSSPSQITYCQHYKRSLASTVVAHCCSLLLITPSSLQQTPHTCIVQVR